MGSNPQISNRTHFIEQGGRKVALLRFSQKCELMLASFAANLEPIMEDFISPNFQPPERDFLDFTSDEFFMRQALHQAERAFAKEEVPVGAVIVRQGKIIARAFNQVETLKDATAHAEMLALTQAESVVDDWRLTDCDLYVTKEPCVMCAGAIMHCRLRRVIFGCSDPKSGAAGGGFINLLQHDNLNHRSEVTSGVLAEPSRMLLKEFFGERRKAAATLRLE